MLGFLFGRYEDEDYVSDDTQCDRTFDFTNYNLYEPPQNYRDRFSGSRDRRSSYSTSTYSTSVSGIPRNRAEAIEAAKAFCRQKRFSI